MIEWRRADFEWTDNDHDYTAMLEDGWVTVAFRKDATYIGGLRSGFDGTLLDTKGMELQEILNTALAMVAQHTKEELLTHERKLRQLVGHFQELALETAVEKAGSIK